MDFRCTVLLVVCCLVGIRGLKLPEPSFRLLEEEIDDVSDSSNDLTEPPKKLPESIEESSSSAEEVTTEVQPPVQDPRVYGMNIGLHYILENINTRLALGEKVHLESLIKVLVMTHKIEKIGGTVNENNMIDLRNVVNQYPESLKEALGQ